MAYTSEAALAWLASKSPLKMSTVAIAKEWGWHRNSAGRFLKEQERSGALKRDGKNIIVYVSPRKPAQLSRPPRASSKKRLRKTSIYFIGTKSYVKIGSANDVTKRLNTLQTAHPETLEVLATIPNVDREVEYDLHKMFDGDRLRGEWFKLSLDLRAFIITARLPAQ